SDQPGDRRVIGYRQDQDGAYRDPLTVGEARQDGARNEHGDAKPAHRDELPLEPEGRRKTRWTNPKVPNHVPDGRPNRRANVVRRARPGRNQQCFLVDEVVTTTPRAPDR